MKKHLVGHGHLSLILSHLRLLEAIIQEGLLQDIPAHYQLR